ncbi:NAD(P)-binding Rossmann-fold superfamily protein isoform X2 [Wolffia australiana]
MGEPGKLRSIADGINGSLKSPGSIQVVELEMNEDREEIFDLAVDKAWRLLGSLDSFVNCYLYAGKIKDPLAVTEDEFHKLVKINFMAAWFLLKAVSRRMKDSKLGGSIILLSSIVGEERGIHPGSAVYASCLGAIHQLIRASAMELGRHQIRVNGIARGLHLDDEYPVSVGVDRAKMLTKDVMPLGRWLDPMNDLASTVIHLVSDDSKFITGTTIFVDGAQSIVRPRMRSFM